MTDISDDEFSFDDEGALISALERKNILELLSQKIREWLVQHLSNLDSEEMTDWDKEFLAGLGKDVYKLFELNRMLFNVPSLDKIIIKYLASCIRGKTSKQMRDILTFSSGKDDNGPEQPV